MLKQKHLYNFELKNYIKHINYFQNINEVFDRDYYLKGIYSNTIIQSLSKCITEFLKLHSQFKLKLSSFTYLYL